MMWIDRASETQRLKWMDPEFRASQTEAIRRTQAEEAAYRAHVARLLMNKVSCRRNPHVSLARVSFLDGAYKPQTDANLSLNPARYEAASFASKVFRKPGK